MAYINEGRPIYITYARNDEKHSGWGHIADVVDIIVNEFRIANIQYSVDTEDIEAGDAISAYEKEIGNSEYTIIIYSDKYFQSWHCMYEFAEIRKNSDNKKGIIYVNADDIVLNDEYINKLKSIWKTKEDYVKSINRNLKEIELAAKDRKFYSEDIMALMAFFSKTHRVSKYNINDLIKKVKKWFTHTFVDLGLPSGTLWADCNVGAEEVWEYGDYFAWGEIKSKSKDYYCWKYYQYSKAYYLPLLTKYCARSKYGDCGYTDVYTILQSSDDAATANWGSDWRMPTKVEFEELIECCNVEWKDDYDGHCVSGMLFISKKIANSSLFLPAAEFFPDSTEKDKGSRGFYWSSNLYYFIPKWAYGFYFNREEVYTARDADRCFGQSVRAVRNKN